MKQLTTPILQVMIDLDVEGIDHIDFMFKQENFQDCTTKLLKTFPTDVTYDSETKIFSIPFTIEDTSIFAQNRLFYMDTRPVYQNGRVLPTEIIELFMCNTLFTEEDIE